MVVTTAARFTIDAVAEAQSGPLSLAAYDVKLYAFDDVLRLLNCKRTFWLDPPLQIREHLRSLPILEEVRRASNPTTSSSDWIKLYHSGDRDGGLLSKQQE